MSTLFIGWHSLPNQHSTEDGHMGHKMWNYSKNNHSRVPMYTWRQPESKVPVFDFGKCLTYEFAYIYIYTFAYCALTFMYLCTSVLCVFILGTAYFAENRWFQEFWLYQNSVLIVYLSKMYKCLEFMLQYCNSCWHLWSRQTVSFSSLNLCWT